MGDLETRRIGRCQWNPPLALHDAFDGDAEESQHVVIAKQPNGCLLQRCEVRHLLQFDTLLQFRKIIKKYRHTAIVGLQLGLQDQAGKQLRLREFLGTVPVRVSRQRLLRDRKRLLQHLPWRFAGCAHPAGYTAHPSKAQPNKRRTSKVFYRAGLTPFLF